MRDIADMKNIEAEMRKLNKPILGIEFPGGIVYYLNGRVLRGQIVADMQADGWLISDPTSDGIRLYPKTD